MDVGLKNGKIPVSIGICAYNEEENISKLLDSTLSQELENVEIVEIVVISSASTDSTDVIVRSFSQKDRRVTLIAEAERNGKASAVNTFLNQAKGEICVIQSADTISTPTTIESICKPIIENDDVGAVGGRPVPIKGTNPLLNFATGFIWEMYANLSAKYPKLGEISAHRNVIRSMPSDATSDDTFLEYAISEEGLKIAYSHDALIFNKGPETLSEYIEQRTRWRGAQIRLYRDTGYYSSSARQGSVNVEVAKYCLLRPWRIPLVIPVCLLEVFCILRAKRMLRNNNDSFRVWDSLESTKNLKD